VVLLLVAIIMIDMLAGHASEFGELK